MEPLNSPRWCVPVTVLATVGTDRLLSEGDREDLQQEPKHILDRDARCTIASKHEIPGILANPGGMGLATRGGSI